VVVDQEDQGVVHLQAWVLPAVAASREVWAPRLRLLAFANCLLKNLAMRLVTMLQRLSKRSTKPIATASGANRSATMLMGLLPCHQALRGFRDCSPVEVLVLLVAQVDLAALLD
jgi:hypothetical protein